MPNLNTTSKLLLPLFLPIFVMDLLLHGVFSFLQTKKKESSSSSTSTMQSIAVGPATETHGAPRRSPKLDDPQGELMTTYPHNNNAHDGASGASGAATTLYELIQHAVTKYGTTNTIAMEHFCFQELRKKKPTDKFPTKIYDYHSKVTCTYQELGDNLANFGQGLRQLGMEPQPSSTDNDGFDAIQDGKFCLVIFEDTCKEWTTALHGALSQSMVVATCYATLGHEAVVNAVNETGATALLVNWKQVQDFYQRAHEMPTLMTIIAGTHELPTPNNNTDSNTNDGIWRPSTTSDDTKNNVQVVSYTEVLEMGKKNPVGPTPPKPSDVAVIMYTSGSTGKPKGVVMKHSHLVAGLAGMVTNVHLREGQERFVSYLPLAHILALQVENVLLSVGATLCYTDPRQLSTAMPKYQPTIFAGVPKVWEMLQTGLVKKMEQGPAPVKMVFDILLQWKMFMLGQYGIDTPVSNQFFGLITSKVFGRPKLEFGVTGGGPMSASLQLFCRSVFNSPVIQGYALTETCVGGCFQATHDSRPGVVGPPVPCVEIVLQSEPEIKDSAGFPYLHTDARGSKGEPVIGRGEICFRGPCVSAGYYKNPDKTKEEFDAEGFFHSGDIGQFTADGVIQIVDRKKNLVKLKGGEYVAVEAMETAFAASPYASAVCVVASGDLDGPMAIVCTDNGALEKWAKQQAGMPAFESVHDLADLKEARQEVVKSFKLAGTDAGLGNLELRIQDVALITDTQWTPGNGMTASMKLDRKHIFKMHDKELKEMYKRNGVEASSD